MVAFGQPSRTTSHGNVSAGFELVAEEFGRNFADRGEVGAAFAVVKDGELVVDLWGGLANSRTGEAWQHDTLEVVFSGSKGLVAVCMLRLIEEGLLSLNRRVSSYWPEFGKPEIRVRDVVAHTARLPGVDTPVSPLQFSDAHHMAGLLAAQAPSADRRASLTYHAMTYGWLCDELVRRVDGREYWPVLCG
jgi:CubicO group peptidase (beta-lactamase class C family)